MPIASANYRDEGELERVMALAMSYMLESPYYIDGFWVSDSDSPSHYKKINLIKNNLFLLENTPDETVRFGEETVLGLYFVGLIDKSLCWSETKDFTNCIVTKEKDSHPNKNDWIYMKAENFSAHFRMAYLHNNTRMLEELAKYQSLTANNSYIDEINFLYEHIESLAGSDNLYRRQFFTDAESRYDGFNQGKIVKALFTSQNYVSSLSHLSDICQNFVHTSEGVYNHWSSSVIGKILCMRITNQQDYSFKYSVVIKLQELYGLIEEYDGKIPYTMHPQPPIFRNTYQTWDLLYLTQIENLLEVETGLKEYFPLAFQEAIKVDYYQFQANNLESAMNMDYLYTPEIVSNIEGQLNRLQNTTQIKNFNHAIGIIRVVGLLLSYNS
tara:strand:+ start:405 stop:1556 length:1152 start_codon:yes stop_codon:yes gene_type:complete